MLDPSRTATDFQFRVLAGDSETGWNVVAVLPPPRLVPLDGRPSPRLRLSYPAYTGWSSLDLPDGSAAVEAVAGTRITLIALADRPIARAGLVFLGDLQSLMPLQAVAPLATLPNPLAAFACGLMTEEFTNEIPASVSGTDRRRLSVNFSPPISGLYALRFTDDSGLTGQRLLDLRTFPDPAPTVVLIRPDPAKDTLDLLVGASIAFEARADDRTFAVQTLGLEYRYVDEPWQTQTVADLQATAQLLPALVGSPVPFSVSHPPGLSIHKRIPLAEFRHYDGRPAAAGETLVVRAASLDWDNVSILKDPGHSGEVSLRLHSTESLEAELQRRLVALREPLKNAVDAQADAAKLTEKANADAAGLVDAEKAQADVHNRLADPRDGLRAKVDRLQQTQHDNRLPPTATTARLDAIDRALARIDEKQLSSIETQLGEAKRDPAKLPDVAKKQQAAAKELKAASEELDRWAGLAELQSDAHALDEQLRKTGENADRLRERLPAGVAPEKLSPNERAALDRSANEHAAAAEKLAGLLAKAEKVREAKKDDPSQKNDVDLLEKAIRNAGGSSSPDELRKAADEVRGNRMAEAAASRAQAESRLKAFEANLSGREASESGEELRRKSVERAKRIDEIRKEQDVLAKKIKDTSDAKARAALAEEQERLRRKTEQLAERSAAEKNTEAAETLQRAADKMEQAAGDLAANRDAAKTAEEAKQELAKAREQAQPKTEPTPESLTREQQEELVKVLKSFRDRQQAAIDESLRLSATAEKAQRWERPLIASLVSLAESEDSLAKELRIALAKSLADSPVFENLAKQAADRMEQAAVRLRERKDDALTATVFVPETETATDETIRKPMREALRRLDQIMNALSEKPKERAAAKPKNGESPTDPPVNGSSPPKPPPLAQLKALRDWQAEIQERTTAFANAHPDSSKLNDDDRIELAELQKAQADIAALFEKLRDSLMPKEELP
jgi:hypothetical protein